MRILLFHFLFIIFGFQAYSQNLDTLFIDSTLFHRATKCQKLSKDDPVFLYSKGMGGEGYLTGTQGSTVIQGTEVTCSKIAVYLDYGNFGADSVFLHQISFPRIPDFPAQKLYISTIVEKPDSFQFYIYGGTPGTGPKGNPIYSQTFNLDDVLLNNDDIELPKPVHVPEQFFLAFDVNKKGNDDTLAFFTGNYQKKCGKGENLTQLLLTDVDTYSKTMEWTRLSKISSPSYDADIIIFPFVRLKNKLVSRDKKQEQTVLRLYPNPSSEFIKVALSDQSDFIGSFIFEISDLSGRSINDHLALVDGKLDVSNFPAGYYILTAKNNNMTYRSKLVIN